MPNPDDLREMFTHKPLTAAQESQVHTLFTPARIFAESIHKHCEPSAARDFALQLVLTAVWTAVSVIATQPPPETNPTDAKAEETVTDHGPSA